MYVTGQFPSFIFISLTEDICSYHLPYTMCIWCRMKNALMAIGQMDEDEQLEYLELDTDIRQTHSTHTLHKSHR